MTFALAPQVLVVDREVVELAHEEVHDVVLLVPFEDDIDGLRMVLQGRVEDLLLDDLVDGELGLDRG